ncbi:hypothetical protein FGB62_206g04 [Gracilaria domingensis]|nr:hypothetical protein FGB62_206g04 [Gracilaria domingensis]
MSGVSNGSDEHILLALDNPAAQPECVNPTRLIDVGEFIFFKLQEDKPSSLNGIVTLDDINAILTDPAQNWTNMVLHSRNGEPDIRLFAGGPGGQHVVLLDPEREGLLVADFESGSLCKGFLDDIFTCYDMAAQLTVSQLAYSLASVQGGSLFLQTQFDNAAKLFRFKAGLVTNSIGDPSLEENLFEQKVNESGYQWLSRLQRENDLRRSLSISTLKLDSQLQSTSCDIAGSVPIRPLQLGIRESLRNGPFMVNVSATGELKLVKAGKNLHTIMLTRVGEDWNCAVEYWMGMCLSSRNRTLYVLGGATGTYEYTVGFALRTAQSIESVADLAVLLAHRMIDGKRNGRVAYWDIQNLLPSSSGPLEGARSISRRLNTSVAVSSGVRATGTIGTWAAVIYGSLLLLFVLVALFFRLKPLSSIQIEEMYRREVWQKDTELDIWKPQIESQQLELNLGR